MRCVWCHWTYPSCLWSHFQTQDSQTQSVEPAAFTGYTQMFSTGDRPRQVAQQLVGSSLLAAETLDIVYGWIKSFDRVMYSKPMAQEASGRQALELTVRTDSRTAFNVVAKSSITLEKRILIDAYGTHGHISRTTKLLLVEWQLSLQQSSLSGKTYSKSSLFCCSRDVYRRRRSITFFPVWQTISRPHWTLFESQYIRWVLTLVFPKPPLPSILNFKIISLHKKRKVLICFKYLNGELTKHSCLAHLSHKHKYPSSTFMWWAPHFGFLILSSPVTYQTVASAHLLPPRSGAS